MHGSIDVPDLRAGLQFYEAVFGFVESARPFPTMAVLDANSLTVVTKENGNLHAGMVRPLFIQHIAARRALYR